MIRVFRNIRQNLLKENKLSRYLIYAFGEIILVVIGILIALQINTWNDFRKERQKEQLLLQNFKENLSKDIGLLKTFHDATLKGAKAVDTTLLMVNGQLEFNSISFFSSIERIVSNSYFQCTSATFDQAISTGKIDLIQDNDLRLALLEYYKLTKLNFEDNRYLETNQEYVFPNVFSKLAPTKDVALTITGIETALPGLDLTALATDPEFNTWVVYKKIAFQRQTGTYLFYHERAQDLLDKIDSQLETP